MDLFVKTVLPSSQKYCIDHDTGLNSKLCISSQLINKLSDNNMIFFPSVFKVLSDPSDLPGKCRSRKDYILV